MPATELGRLLIGGIARAELPFAPIGLAGQTMELQDFVLPPLPNQLFTRDSSCWIYGGVTINRCTGRRAARKQSMSPPSTSFTLILRRHLSRHGLAMPTPYLASPRLKVAMLCHWRMASF